ncbi:hypothetical protein PSTG_02928 [Puccinia striiformis f. sp. tritici PST-78]|uniref:Uncharacterized protein n=1 Tax=Puccinia striiformis f. sp. tritici PST-78 TaxID=1165861 RepID=A0A0L0VXS6_9BASI|nr:hypothetical protein PSTG_02928 [Puccinia striiformis f. sp. tritici PST-78]
MLKSIKKRLVGSSKSNIVCNLKRAIQSTPDLSKQPSSLSRNSLDGTPILKPNFHASTQSSTAMDGVLSSPGYIIQHGTTAPVIEEVLFTPLKEPIKSVGRTREKLKLKFILRKKKVVESQEVEESTAPTSLPMITLTTPEDEQIYILHRPTPPISSHTFLSVPSSSISTSTISGPRKPPPSAKRWPHPAGPWLRPTSSEEYEFKTQSDQLTWQEGWRLGTGKVIGWDAEDMHALGICFPPQLPTEHDLKTIALVEQISKSLDQAQDALYGSLENEWDPEIGHDEYETKIVDGYYDYPACVELPHIVEEAGAV